MMFTAAKPDDTRWFTHQTSYRPSSEFGGIVALNDDGERMGMVGLDFWTPNAVQMHIVLRDVACLPGLWKEVTGYLRQHGRKLVYAVTPGGNDISLRLQKSLGFVEKYRIADGWNDGEDMVIAEKRL